MPVHLATYVQISDLHFGHIDPSPEAGPYNSAAPAHWAYAQVFKGLFGHHHRALVHLQQFMAGVRQAEPQAQLIVTGDLTACGHPDQFATAVDFLGGALAPPKGTAGLGIPNWRDYAIMGNHDHWPGNGHVTGPASAALGATFRPPLPRSPVTWSVPLPARCTLRFIAVATDADVADYGMNRRFARGRFRSQISFLDANLPAHAPREIRVLLLHHSRLYGHPNYRQLLLLIVKSSRRFLDQLLVEHGIAVMLCGHTHVADVKTHTAAHPDGRAANVLEACCGTTTQRNGVPSHWTRFPNWTFEPNTLIVHRLYEDVGVLTWQAEKYIRTSHGFQPMPAAQQPQPFFVPLI